MLNAHAALAYAEAGFHVIPVRLGSKNPGSYLGRGWPAQATCDIDTVGMWWDRWPDAGIAIHVGGCGLLVIDVDSPDNVPEWLWPLLEHAVFRPTTTDPDSKRGHYFYRLRSGELFGCGLGQLKLPNGEKWGEVKCYGGAVVLGPTVHPRADEGGHYATGPGGQLQFVPDEIAAKLNAASDSGERRSLTPAELHEKVRAFLDTYTDDDEPQALDSICRNFDPTPDNRHPSMWQSLCWAMREAKAGRFSATRAADALRRLWAEAIGGEYRDDDPDEFDRMFRDAIAAADADGTVDELRARAHGFSSPETHRAALENLDAWAPKLIDVPASNGERVTRSLADVEPTKVMWLWPYWIPLGKVSILEGEPGEGKSLLTLAMTALVTIGGELPMTMVDGDMVPRSSFGPAGVVLVGVEDDEADTVVPRLDAAGADRTRVYVMNQPTDDNGNPKPFLIPEDVNRLRRAIGEVNAKAVFIDPLTAFLSTKHVKAGDDPSTRQALMPLVMLAADAGCAIVLVRHLNKASGMSATHRGSGTIAFAGITRSVIVAGKLKEPAPDGATHAIARTKGNLSKEPMAIGYRIDSAADDPDSPVVRWCSPMDLTADQLVGADGAKVGDARKNAPVRNECERVLSELLADGVIKQAEAVAKTREAVACSAKTVRDAAERIGVVKKQVRVGGQIDHWTWELPPNKIRFEDLRDGGEEKLDTADS